MKFSFLVCVFFFALVSNGFAQYTSAKDSDPEAVKLLTTAGKTFSSKNAKVNFTLKVTYPGTDAVTSEGVLYQKGKAYRLELKDYVIMSDGSTR